MMRAAVSGRPALKCDATVNVVWDGNSLVDGLGSTGGQTLPVQTAALPPIAGSGASASVEVATSGDTWAAMSAGGGAVDAAWLAGRTNILIVWEHVNSICGGLQLTAAQSAAAMAAFCAQRRAVNPWIILGLSTIPCEDYAGQMTSQAIRDTLNGRLRACDDLISPSPLSYGLDAYIDLRAPGSPFNFPNYQPATFNGSGAIWNEAAGSRLHLNNAGYGVVAQMVARKLAAIRVRPHK